MYNISLVTPTRKRLDGLKRMWHSALDTAKEPDKIELVLYIDHDDIETVNGYHELRNQDNIVVIISDPDKPKEIYTNLHNICCEASTADIFFQCVDDIVFRTDNWDEIVINKFNEFDDKIAYLFPDDCHWGSKFGTHGFFHKAWYNALGHISPPYFTVDWADNYINDIAKAVDRWIYLENVIIEHMHWTFGKMEFDETARDGHQRRRETNNEAIYKSFETINKMREDIQKLRECIDESK
jgi:hypothetical protein